MKTTELYYSNRNIYHVIVERAKNDVDGNPRYSVTLWYGIGATIAKRYTVAGYYKTAEEIADEELKRANGEL